MTNWIIAETTRIKKWNKQLFTIFIKAKIDKFIPGQFSKISIITKKNKRIQRAYSYVNPPKKKEIEFYISKISEGTLSPSLYSLQPSDKIYITKKSFGTFTLQNINSCPTLWMMSTGTAIGPYLSILQEKNKDILKFNKIILIHAVRYLKDLSYGNKIEKLKERYNGKLIFINVLSREKQHNSITGRIPQLILNKSLETLVGLPICPKKSHVMLCGNPNMVKETSLILQQKYNMTKNFKNKPGTISSENYW